MTLARILHAGLLLALAGCASAEPDPLPQSELQLAERLLEEGRAEEAYDTLQQYKRTDFDRQTQGEYSLLAGDAAYRSGDYNEAIRHYEDFLQFEGAASESRIAEERMLEMGLALLTGDRLSIGIFTNKSKGALTLENLAAWAPYSPLAAEALARLGEYHYSEEDYADAVSDYRQILRFHPDSEWIDLATFRIGMCQYKQIKNEYVDGSSMRMTLNQLRGYLSEYPSGLYRTQAQDAVLAVENLLAEHELSIGDFYEVIDNVRGARYHYRLASNYGDTDAGREAMERLAELPPDPELAMPDYEDDEDQYQEYLEQRAGAAGDTATQEATTREGGSGG